MTKVLTEVGPDNVSYIAQLEAENTQLRRIGNDRSQRPNFQKNDGLLSKLPAAQAQMINVQSTYEELVPEPKYIPLYKSPPMHWLCGMFVKDTHNYKKFIGQLFNTY